MRVVLAGASGLIGQALHGALRSDAATTSLVLVRRAPTSAGRATVASRAARARPGRRSPAPTRWSACPAPASATTAGPTRTSARSCTQPARHASARIAACARRLRRGRATFVSASAVGYYGDTGDRRSTRAAPPGDRLPGRAVCRQWEAAARPARARRASASRTLRTGLVLPARGGLLKRLMPIVRLGVAGRLGSGQAVHARGSRSPTRSPRSGFVLEHDVARAGEPDRPGTGAQCRVHGGARRSCCTGRPCCPRPRFALTARARRVRRGRAHRPARAAGELQQSGLRLPARRPRVRTAVGAGALTWRLSPSAEPRCGSRRRSARARSAMPSDPRHLLAREPRRRRPGSRRTAAPWS